MYDLEITVVINRPIDVVFKNTTCLRGCINWSSALQTAELVNDVKGKVGSRFKQTSKFMGLNSTQFLTITLYDEPHEFISEDNESPHKFVSHYRFKEVPEGTQVTLKMAGSIEQALIGRLAEALIARNVRRQLETDLLTLKELLENDVTVHAT